MKPVRFSEEKDKWLRKERNIGFSEVIEEITKKEIIKVIDNPNKKKYPRQKIYLIKINNYVFSVPFVEEKEYFFLKTIIPSRKQTKKYLEGYKFNKQI